MVELKRKVTLKTKVREAQPEPAIVESSVDPKKNYKWVWGIVLLVAAIVGFFLLIPDSNKEETSQSVIANSEEQVIPKEVGDTIEVVSKGEEAIADNVKNIAEKLSAEKEGSEQATASDVTEDTSVASSNSAKKDEKVVRPSVTAKLLTGTLEQKAVQVIRGDFGNGEERKVKLGEEYSSIQAKVNEMYANGLVY